MYNIKGFGKRISCYRKALEFTQEELAEKLNISAQAVSKWENELSFPEITMLPLLTKVLNTSIEKLFGNEDDTSRYILAEESLIPSFPATRGDGLALVHTLGTIGCYSIKEVDITSDDTVFFKDGSSANLKQLKIINRGPGDICFEFLDSVPVITGIDMSKTELHEKFDKIDSIELSVNGADFNIHKSQDNKTHIEVNGSPLFIANLKIIQNDGFLSIKCMQENNCGGNNKVNIYFAGEIGKEINAGINGYGNINASIPFKRGHIAINGAGNINVSDIFDLVSVIRGSGDISCGNADNLEIIIHGSGDFKSEKISKSLKASIHGSGDICLGSGEIDNFDVSIRGSGMVEATEVSTVTANLSVDGSGAIKLGRVIKESVEKHCKGSSINVLKRG